MYSTTYALLENEDHDVIIHDATGIRVHVFNLEVDTYIPTQGELRIFGDDHGEWLVFETEGWNGEDLDIITQAVVWYARYLDNPHMQIQEDDPRPVNRLRSVEGDLN